MIHMTAAQRKLLLRLKDGQQVIYRGGKYFIENTNEIVRPNTFEALLGKKVMGKTKSHPVKFGITRLGRDHLNGPNKKPTRELLKK